MLRCAAIFRDHMVLQREKPIRIFGQADPESRIEVRLEGPDGTDASVAFADETGNWSAVLRPREAGGGCVLTVSDDSTVCRFEDILFGEVWLAGGQSNMEFFLGFEEHFDADAAKSANPFIRFYDVPRISYEGELEDFDYSDFGVWRKAEGASLPFFSAVGYYFACRLYESLRVPIGIVGCNWGGTPACAWMDPDYLRNGPGEVWLTDYEEGLRSMDVKAVCEAYKKNPATDRTHPFSDPFNEAFVKASPSREAQLLEMEKNPPAPPLICPLHEQRPGGLYQTMLLPLARFALRGFLFYQGESDAEIHPGAYEEVLESLIANWRDLWGESLPFLYVQLAPFGAWMDCDGKSYVQVRAAQDRLQDQVPGIFMASSSDAGMLWDIHPKNKKVIGERLALLARGRVYRQDLLCLPPRAKSARISDGDLIICFDHARGLHQKGSRLNGLQILTSNGDILYGISCEIRGSELILHDMTSARALFFAQTDYYEVNLYNEAGLPALPFTLWVDA